MSVPPGLAAATVDENNEENLLIKFRGQLPHKLGPANIVCKHCGAYRWPEERTKAEAKANSRKFSNCCKQGDVTLPLAYFEEAILPDALMKLYVGTDEVARDFQKKIVTYNNLLSFASLGVKQDTSVIGQKGTYTFRVNGQLHHNIGSLLPEDNQEACFAQIFIVGDGGDGEVNLRASKLDDKKYKRTRNSKKKNPNTISKHTIRLLQDIINKHNPYAIFLRDASDIIKADETTQVLLKSLPPGNREMKTYNKPRPNDVAALVRGSGEMPSQPRDVLVRHKDGFQEHITDLNTGYLPLRYPLMLPFGSQQWDGRFESPTIGTNENCKREGYNVSALQWAAWLLFERENQFSPFVHGRRLTQQLIVDLYLCVEKNNLRYIRGNQKKLKADSYQGMRESFNDPAGHTGRSIILPSSFHPGPRHMSELYHDGMALVREHGTPSLFITMTTNPEWEEIQRELKYGEKAEDRPDIVARVFHLKLSKLIEELNGKNRLGVVISHLMVVEFQKRGLPHAHILCILEESSRPKTAEQVDALVTAVIPDPEKESRLFDLVTTHMLHGPCQRQPCWVDGHCKAKFPKTFSDETTVSDSGFYNYRRPDDGIIFEKEGHKFSNANVVSYNKYLLLLFECHINVEIPLGTKPVRYLYKYLTKGHDRTRITVDVKGPNGTKDKFVDEILEFQEYRYISAPECAYRLFQYAMNSRSPFVVRLSLHLEGAQTVYFVDKEEAQRRITIGPPPKSTLTEYFRLCAEDEVGKGNVRARDLYYVDIVKHFLWKNGRFVARDADLRPVGRMYFANIADGEKYFLRLLLNNVKGAQSFEYLRTVNGVIYPTFREAADKLGLLQSDRHHEEALKEASIWSSSAKLRNLLGLIMVYGVVASPDSLWTRFSDVLSEDVERILEKRGAKMPMTDEIRKCYALALFDEVLEEMGKSVRTIGFRPDLVADLDADIVRKFPPSMFVQDQAKLSQQEFETRIPTLNQEQSKILKYVMDQHTKCKQFICFLDGPGGTGKTYTLNTILHYFYSKNTTPLAVASSGVAAILLLKGRTAHSAFNIPLNVDKDSTCDLTGADPKSKIITSAPVIIWDEVSMQHKHAVEAVDRSLQHILKNKAPFGGLSVIFGGDFRQTLPIVKHSSMWSQKDACVKMSYLWKKVKGFALKKNLRLKAASSNDQGVTEEFAEWLLKLGEGKLQQSDMQTVPIEYVRCDLLPNYAMSPTSMIEWLYGGVETLDLNDNWESVIDFYSQRLLITPLNTTVNALNNLILSKLPGDALCSISTDEMNETYNDPVATECLNDIDFPGFPDHRIELKVGQPIMILRNLSLGTGLCNGTRLVIMERKKYVLGCMIITGPKRGETINIPRMKFVHSGDLDHPIPFSRIQFPVTSAFVLTINKAQGQSLGKVGIFLSAPIFSHGQLYVALSRCTSLENVRLSMVSRTGMKSTTNIVLSLPH